MNHDAMNDPDHSSHDHSSHDRTSASGEKPTENTRKPFVRPELRRETGLIDGTRGSHSGMQEYDDE